MSQRIWTPIKEYSDILFEFFEGIAKITINRPEVYNAFRPQTNAQILEALNYCREHPEVRDTVYWPFVSDYVGEGYERVCQNWMDFTNEACRSLEPERAQKCREVFMRCSEHELEFWRMSEHPRTDV